MHYNIMFFVEFVSSSIWSLQHILTCLGWYRSVQRGMETLPGPDIKIKACHCLKNNSKHKRAADNHVNPESIRRSPEK